MARIVRRSAKADEPEFWQTSRKAIEAVEQGRWPW
jgi:hypothetical protein